MINSLSSEQQIFLDILRNYLNNECSFVDDEIQWSEIEQYANKHQLTPIFYHQTRRLQFQKGYCSQLYRTVNFKQEIDSFEKVIEGYQYLFVKGAKISLLYPVPELRTMGDVDILIHENDRKYIHQLLLDSQFEYLGEERGESKYSKKGFLFELHDTLIHKYDGKDYLVEYFSQIWDYVDGFDLDWSFHLLYLFEHLRQHFVNEGVGFRQFMDIAVVCQKCEINWIWLENNLKKIRLYDFAITVLAFIGKWFDVVTPLSIKELDKEFYIKSTDRIFRNGVFGFENDDNKRTQISFQMYYSDSNFQDAKRKYLINTIFPSYVTMCSLPYCQYVNKSKFFLPFAWIHRIVYRVFDKKRVDDVIQNLDQESVADRMKLFHGWGL